MRNSAWSTTLLLFVMLGSSCSSSSIHPPIHPDLSNRLQTIKTVAVSPPFVVGYRQPYHLSETRRISLPETATSNLVVAVHKHFSQQQLFVLHDVDLQTSMLAPATPPWLLYTNSDPDSAGYGPILISKEGMNFKPKAFMPPAPEIGTDAAIFTFAWEKTTTAGGMSKKSSPLTILFLPLILGDELNPDNPQSYFRESFNPREVCIGICLIDCRTGEVLWSDIEVGYGRLKLQDPDTAGTLVGKAFKKLETRLPSAPGSVHSADGSKKPL
jgi:hypothetical protein